MFFSLLKFSIIWDYSSPKLMKKHHKQKASSESYKNGNKNSHWSWVSLTGLLLTGLTAFWNYCDILIKLTSKNMNVKPHGKITYCIYSYAVLIPKPSPSK